MTRSNIHRVLDSLAASERRFQGRQILAAVSGGGEIRVRIDGVACRLKASPADFRGIGLYRAVSFNEAELERSAKLSERRDYLALFPRGSMILCARDNGRWLGAAAHGGDSRFHIEGLAPIELVEEGQAFDTVYCRFDGERFWFDSPNVRCDPTRAAYLRESLSQSVDPEKLARRGLTAEERLAYRLVVERRRPQVARRTPSHRAGGDRHEARLRESLLHSGAQMVGFAEQGDVYRVTYIVDGQRHVSAVSRDDLTVQSAGICLDGGDRNFDLTSLVGVLREGRQRGEIVRM